MYLYFAQYMLYNDDEEEEGFYNDDDTIIVYYQHLMINKWNFHRCFILIFSFQNVPRILVASKNDLQYNEACGQSNATFGWQWVILYLRCKTCGPHMIWKTNVMCPHSVRWGPHSVLTVSGHKETAGLSNAWNQVMNERQQAKMTPETSLKAGQSTAHTDCMCWMH